MTATPSWYDVLDLDASATESDVRAAWKTAIADLEPSDRRFRLLNRAAEVLLDRDRRAAYDLELMGAELDAHQDESALAEDPTEPEATPDEPAAAPRVVPGWLLVAVAAVAALVVGACAVVASTAPSDASIADATRQAQSSAERAIVPILSYDAVSRATSRTTSAPPRAS